MSNRTFLQIDDLVVWSDNPRNGYMENSTSLSEKEVINLLIDVVGEKKMLNLASDIMNSRGLNGNVIPTVVLKNGKYCVYDGNRRISAIKMLLKPSIIESDALKDRITTLSQNKDLSFLRNVFVYVTDEKEAIELMDKTHTGEQDGVGVIPWDAYNRDISLVKRGQNPKYPYSYKIAFVMGFKKKKDFLIPYTDYQRLFSSKAMLDSFGIKNINSKNKENIEMAINALWLFKKRMNFASFSRYFNITDSNDDSDSKKPINTFINWWQEQQKSQSTYIIKIDKREIFTDSIYTLDYSTIHIFLRKNMEEIIYNENDLSIAYIDPTNKKHSSLNKHIGGKWLIEVLYKGVSAIGEIVIRTLLDSPDVSFLQSFLFVRKGETLDLRKTIKYAKSIHGNEMSLKMVQSVGDYKALINGFILTSNNEPGKYFISYVFDNDGEEYSTVTEITVNSNKNRPFETTREVPFEFPGNFSASFSFGVQELMKEINELWLNGNYKYVISCSIRSVVELSLDFIFAKNNYIFAINDSLETKMSKLADYFLANSSELQNLSNKLKVSYRGFQNELQNLKNNTTCLNAIINIGAHKSGTRIDTRDMFDKTHTYVTLIVQIAEGLK